MRQTVLVVAAVTVLLLPVTVPAQSPREQLIQLTDQLQKSPRDAALRERLIKLATEIKPAPGVTPEAEKFEGRAQYAFRSAKSEAELLDAAREYLKAVEAAPWVAGYYHDICVILEKANRPAEAARACKLYLVAAPPAADASNVRKLVAGLEYALERERGAVVNRSSCTNMTDIYDGGAKVARIGSQKISIKLYSSLYGGVWRNQLAIYDITVFPGNIFGQRFELDPLDRHFRLEDRVPGTPSFRLTIGRDGRITFGGSGSPQAEIVTSITELHQLRNEQLKKCVLASRASDNAFLLELAQGGSLRPNDGARINGGLYFAADCRGSLTGDKPGWFPVLLVPHPETPGVTAQQSDPGAQGITFASGDACRRNRNDGLGWLSP